MNSIKKRKAKIPLDFISFPVSVLLSIYKENNPLVYPLYNLALFYF